MNRDSRLPVREAERDERAAQTFAALYRRYVERLYRYALVRLGSLHDAQVLTTQVFQAAQEELDVHSAKAFLVGLMRIARRELSTFSRQAHKAWPASAITSTRRFALPKSSVAEQHAQLEQAMQALYAMPADCAEVLAMRIFAGLSAAQVGQVMDKSEADIKLLLRRAIRDFQSPPSSVDGIQEWIEIEIEL